MRILVVDDDPDIREYLELALIGHEVLSSAVAEVEVPCDLALVDLLLGDGDGLALIRRLVGQGARVLVMTGLAADSPLVQDALTAGATLLSKPFSLESLRQAVRVG